MELNPFGIIVLGFGGSLLGVLGLVFGKRYSGWAIRLLPFVVTIAAGVLALASDAPLRALLPLSLAGFWFAVLCGDRLLQAASRMLVICRRPVIAWGTLLVASPLLALVWSYWSIEPIEYWDPPQIVAIDRTAVEMAGMRTDTGRIVKATVPVRSATQDELDAAKNQQVIPNLICTDPPGFDYNCHGWVFTGGLHWISTGDVANILRDNGYYPVENPDAGDIIVYYRGDELLHSGLVRSADELGIIVESKWGYRGRYIHLPEQQDYSDEYVYYRSDRKGHVLRGLEAAPMANRTAKAETPRGN